MPTQTATTRGPVLRVVAAACVVAATLLGTLGLGAAPAEATAYRYWSYWTGGSAGWTFASQGAARVPADGSVDGWRFAVSPATGSSKPPRTAAGFGAVCGSTDPVAGSKRVAVVVDYGTDADAPPGDPPPDGPVAACVVIRADANGYAVLAEATRQIRVEGGLVCGVSGYPATGCGEPVADPTPTSSRQPTPRPSGTSTAGASTPPSGQPTPEGSRSTGSPRSDGPGRATRTATSQAPSPTSPPSSASASPLTASLPPPVDPSDGAPGGPPLGVAAAVLALAALAGGAVVVARRRT